MTTATEQRLHSAKRGMIMSSMSKTRTPVDASTYSGKVAVRVRALREAKKWPVDRLADKLGISPKTLYCYEAGTRGIPVDLFPALAKALGVTAAEFFPPLR